EHYPATVEAVLPGGALAAPAQHLRRARARAVLAGRGEHAPGRVLPLPPAERRPGVPADGAQRGAARARLPGRAGGGRRHPLAPSPTGGGGVSLCRWRRGAVRSALPHGGGGISERLVLLVGEPLAEEADEEGDLAGVGDGGVARPGPGHFDLPLLYHAALE